MASCYTFRPFKIKITCTPHFSKSNQYGEMVMNESEYLLLRPTWSFSSSF